MLSDELLDKLEAAANTGVAHPLDLLVLVQEVRRLKAERTGKDSRNYLDSDTPTVVESPK